MQELEDEATLLAGTKGCHREYDLLHESTWVVGNKQHREVWQLIVDRRQGSNKTTTCR